MRGHLHPALFQELGDGGEQSVGDLAAGRRELPGPGALAARGVASRRRACACVPARPGITFANRPHEPLQLQRLERRGYVGRLQHEGARQADAGRLAPIRHRHLGEHAEMGEGDVLRKQAYDALVRLGQHGAPQGDEMCLRRIHRSPKDKEAHQCAQTNAFPLLSHSLTCGQKKREGEPSRSSDAHSGEARYGEAHSGEARLAATQAPAGQCTRLHARQRRQLRACARRPRFPGRPRTPRRRRTAWQAGCLRT